MPSGTPSDKGVFLTVHPLSCPNTDTVYCSAAKCPADEASLLADVASPQAKEPVNLVPIFSQNWPRFFKLFIAP